MSKELSKQQALEYHAKGRPGKIEVIPTKESKTQRDLSLAYSPGVAVPCLEIAANPEDVYKYTAKGNLVAYGLMIDAGAKMTQMENRIVLARFKDGYGPVGAYFLHLKTYTQNGVGEEYESKWFPELQKMVGGPSRVRRSYSGSSVAAASSPSAGSSPGSRRIRGGLTVAMTIPGSVRISTPSGATMSATVSVTSKPLSGAMSTSRFVGIASGRQRTETTSRL